MIRTRARNVSVFTSHTMIMSEASKGSESLRRRRQAAKQEALEQAEFVLPDE